MPQKSHGPAAINGEQSRRRQRVVEALQRELVGRAEIRHCTRFFRSCAALGSCLLGNAALIALLPPTGAVLVRHSRPHHDEHAELDALRKDSVAVALELPRADFDRNVGILSCAAGTTISR